MLILAYHRVNPEVRDGLSVSPGTLAAHLTTLRDRGWQNVILEDAIRRDPADLPDRAFAITFDDGYQDNFFHAAPVLRRLGMQATVYVVSSMIDSDAPFPWLKPASAKGFDCLDLHMTRDQLREGHADGVFRYGSHTLTHPMLSMLDRGTARLEVVGSKAALENQLDVEITTFCYPAGNFNDETVELVVEAGYEAAVVTPNRHIPETPQTLHRVGIYSHITPRLFDVKTSRVFERVQRTKAFWHLRHRLNGRRSR